MCGPFVSKFERKTFFPEMVMKFNSVDRELNRHHVGIKVSYIRASVCACAANFWNLIRKAFNNCANVSDFQSHYVFY